jgi:hypothetical protein
VLLLLLDRWVKLSFIARAKSCINSQFRSGLLPQHDVPYDIYEFPFSLPSFPLSTPIKTIGAVLQVRLDRCAKNVVFAFLAFLEQHFISTKIGNPCTF